MTADLAHRSGDDDAGDDDDPDGGPGGPLAMKTRQLRRTSGFRGGWTDTSSQGTRISPWRLTLHKRGKRETSTDPVQKFRTQHVPSIPAKIQRHSHHAVQCALNKRQPRGGDPPGIAPIRHGYQERRIEPVPTDVPPSVVATPVVAANANHSNPVGETTLLSGNVTPNTDCGKAELIDRNNRDIQTAECVATVKSSKETDATLVIWEANNTGMMDTGDNQDDIEASAPWWNHDGHDEVGSCTDTVIALRRVFDRGRSFVHDRGRKNKDFGGKQQFEQPTPAT